MSQPASDKDEPFDVWLAREYPDEKIKADVAIAEVDANRRNMLTATWASIARPDLVREHAATITPKEGP